MLATHFYLDTQSTYIFAADQAMYCANTIPNCVTTEHFPMQSNSYLCFLWLASVLRRCGLLLQDIPEVCHCLSSKAFAIVTIMLQLPEMKKQMMLLKKVPRGCGASDGMKDVSLRQKGV